MRGKKVKQLKKLVFKDSKYNDGITLRQVQASPKFKSMFRARKKRYNRTGQLTL